MRGRGAEESDKSFMVALRRIWEGRGIRATGYVVRGWVEKVERREGECLEAGGI